MKRHERSSHVTLIGLALSCMVLLAGCAGEASSGDVNAGGVVRSAGGASAVSGEAVPAAARAMETTPTARGASDLPRPTFTADGRINLPERYREWVYVGTPLTPNSLNPPEAPFPEFHSVYIHPDDFAEYSRSGVFPQGTMIVKELVTVGSEQAVSGNGFFMGEFAGLEITVKDQVRFPDEPGNWAYFSYGHALPYAATAEIMPTGACNSCHQASAAEDFVFTQYYPVLRDAKGSAAR